MIGTVLLLSSALASGARAGALAVKVVDQAGAPVENAVVFVKGLSEASESTAVMDQMDLQFTPHVLAVPVGAKVSFPNKDQVHHHLYSFSKTKHFELPLYQGTDVQPVAFDKPGVVKLGCNIHDWMAGYIVVLANPYFAVTNADGRARFSAPDGEREVTLWSERLTGAAASKKATLGAKEASLTFSITAKPAPEIVRKKIKKSGAAKGGSTYDGKSGGVFPDYAQ